jgi:putative ABC transport system substrate-binding protein
MTLRRRDFLTLLGGAAAAWPVGARAQQPAMPVAGFLVSATREGYAGVIDQVRLGLGDEGFVEGRNLVIEYRYADDQYDRLPDLAADLVRRQVAVLFATGSVVAAIAAKNATKTIPIVFGIGSDPIQYGLVEALNRPGGNATGVSFYNSELGPKRLEVLREMLPKATLFAMLVNPTNANAASDASAMQKAAQALGVRLLVVNAAGEGDFPAVFAMLRDQRADALIINNDAMFQSRIKQIVGMAQQDAMPTMAAGRTQAAAGALISYGPMGGVGNRQAGVYVGRVLKGQKPADLPVILPSKFELVINLKTAKALGLTIPLTLQYAADEVIE